MPAAAGGKGNVKVVARVRPHNDIETSGVAEVRADPQR